MISRTLLSGIVGIAAALSGCVALPPPVSQPMAPQAAAQRAADLARGGEHAQAAAAYESIATTAARAQQVDLQLSAAREWLAAGRAVDATRVLAHMEAAQTASQGYERSLLDAETSLVANRTEEAWQKISTLTGNAASGLASRYYVLKMRIALAAARPIDGIDAEMDAERFASSAVARTELRSQLLSELRHAHERGVRLDPGASSNPIVRGWLELGATATHGASFANAQLAARWRASYPNHPALEILNQAYPSPLISSPPGARVALLLPLTGPAQAQGATVRDGFLSAFYQLPPNARPALHLYDTAAIPAAQAIADAHAFGSTFIVGPLVRENVAAVAALGTQSVPVLALNFLPGGEAAPSGLYQFALSPEEEAQLVARRILAEGHHRGIAVVPRGDWGNRVVDAFARELATGGGSVVAEASYYAGGIDYESQLKSALGIDQSEARHQRLQRVLGAKLNFVPRHRGDLEFVFIAAPSANDARLIEPQLHYLYASDIPSYSISNAYEPDSPAANQDIDGLTYPDMPWMVGGDDSVDGIRSNIAELWGNRTAWGSRLFAFGYDACQLMLALSGAHGDASAVRIDGLSGQLRFDADRRIERELIWVRIGRDGEPKRLSEP